MKMLKFGLILLGLLFSVTSTLVSAEEIKKKIKAEDLVEAPVAGKGADLNDLNQLRRATVTEEQAVAQLKYMMVQGWIRMEKQLLERGAFLPFGMVLSPEGTFNVLAIENQGLVKKDYQLASIVEYLKRIAETRSKWGVGLMYIETIKTADGTSMDYIRVIAEHIAGWARSWSYPYKMVDGEVKLGAPRELVLDPVYFQSN
jgi:hypothetical protein